MSKISTRKNIILSADQLFYQQGFDNTSFAHIADIVKISRGNFYHHFKSKDDILQAVIDLRLSNTTQMLTEWESLHKNPIKRIECFIKILLNNWAKIRLYGCPIGTLTTELSKLDHNLKSHANKIFSLFRNWLSEQFKTLGHLETSNIFAMQLLMRVQGVAVLASAFQDEAFVKHEVDVLCEWLKSPSTSHSSKV